MRLNSYRPPLCTLAAVLLLVAAPFASAAERETLTAPQVSCNRVQLGALAARTWVAAPGGDVPAVPQALYLSYANRHGFYEGVVVGLPRFRSSIEPPVVPAPTPGPEHQLGFHLNPSVRTLLLNPERTPLEQVSLTREISTSTFVDPGDPFAIVLRLDPTLGPPALVAGPGDLVIDNLRGSRAADTKPGRGLTESGLTELCHDRFTDLDRRVLAILQRTLRAELFDPDRALRYDTRIVVYRGSEPDEYRADLYVVDPEAGEMRPTPLEARIRAAVDPAGRLSEGHLELPVHRLPDAPDVVGHVAIVRPLFGGVDGEYRSEVTFPVGGPLPGAPSSFYDFDWRDVLEGTEWNEAVPVTSECGQGTAADLAATPRERPDLELLAIGMTGDLTADQEVYDRLDRDLAAIRASDPSVADIPFLAPHNGKRMIVVADSLASYRAIQRDEYQEWDCLNGWYGLEAVDADALFPEEHPWLTIRLEGIYDLERVAADYQDLSGIAEAEPDGHGLPAIPLPSMCAAIAPDGETFRYFFETANDLISHITTDPDGEIELVGRYNPHSLGPAPPPDWFPLVEECYATVGALRG